MAKPSYQSNGQIKSDLPKVKLTKESLKESLALLHYVKPYKLYFGLGLLFIGLSGLTTMAVPYLLKTLIDSVNGTPSNGLLMVYGSNTIVAIMFVVLVIQMIFSFLRVYLFSYVGENALADLRRDVYQKLITMPVEFFSKHRVGELSSRISADISQIQDTITSVLAEILRGAIVLLIGLGLIFMLSLKLTLLMLSIVPVIVVIAIIFSRKIRQYSRQAQDQLAESNIIVQETFQAITNVKVFSNEWFEIGRYTASTQKVVKIAVKNGIFRGIFISLLLFSVFSTVVIVVWYGTHLMKQGALSFGDLTAFVIYTAFVGGTMAGFADLYSQLQKTVGATQRVREILLEKGEAVNALPTSIEPRYILYGDVTLDNVSFSYPSRNDIVVLQGISFNIKSGEQIAIVGPSGAGKSTLISLLLKFYEPSEGNILFDGKPGKDVPISQLRQQMAFVPQDILLFGGTIFDNIAYGKPGASANEVMEAAKKANANTFISMFPEGYQTIVGERGVMLSGGQRQRVAIARAILKDPVILILDEATSALDSESEILVQEALQNLMKGRTSFVIAHRFSTIRGSHKIIVLENGRIVESGTHQELLNNGALYSRLNKLQEHARQ